MNEVERKVMSATKALLCGLVESNALSAHQATDARMAISALDHQLAEDACDPAGRLALKKSEIALAKEMGSLLGPASSAAPKRKWVAQSDPPIGAKLALEVYRDTETRPDTTREQRVAEELRAFLVAYHEPVDPLISQGPRASYGAPTAVGGAEREGGVNRQNLEAHLRERVPEHKGTTVTAVNQLGGGYSKGTFMAMLETPRGAETIILRQDRPGLPTGSSVMDEFVALQEVYKAGVRAPKPLWAEPEGARFGPAVMAVGFCPGQPGRNFPTETARREKWAFGLADAMAELHMLSRKPDLDVRDVMRAEIAGLRARLDAVEKIPHPGLEFGLTWLVAHLDDLKGRPACRTHGDLAYHNVLIENDEITALLDWEFTRAGDPAEDLAYIRPFIEEFGLWDEFLRRYTVRSGFTYEAAAGKYFRVFNAVRIAVCNVAVFNTFMRPDIKELALFVAGAILGPKFEIALLDAIIET